MTDRSLRRWGQASFALIAALFAAALVATALFGEIEAVTWGPPGFLGQLVFLIAMFTFPLVGILIVSRQPRHAIGWLLMAIGAAWGTTSITDAWIAYAERANVAYLDLLLSLTGWLWVPGVGLMGTYLVLLFPDGKVPSPRWRPLAWASGLVLISVSVLNVFGSRDFTDLGRPGIENPLYVTGAPSGAALIPLVPLCGAACVGALIYRFRRSRGAERLQLKWFVAAAATAVALASVAVAASVSQDETSSYPVWVQLLQLLELCSFALLPTATGVAILRHRLYEIDVVINRALVYATLTALLAACYVALVFALRSLLASITAESDLAIAASTLGVAALFRPLRHRVQSFIDRRFYRRKVDAQKTLEHFSRDLRDEVDLTTLAGRLVGVVVDTMQPTHVSLWLRDGEAKA